MFNTCLLESCTSLAEMACTFESLLWYWYVISWSFRQNVLWNPRLSTSVPDFQHRFRTVSKHSACGKWLPIIRIPPEFSRYDRGDYLPRAAVRKASVGGHTSLNSSLKFEVFFSVSDTAARVFRSKGSLCHLFFCSYIHANAINWSLATVSKCCDSCYLSVSVSSSPSPRPPHSRGSQHRWSSVFF